MRAWSRWAVTAWALWIALGVQAQEIQRVEPPFWWVGMRHPGLQLMVHGPGVGRWQVVVRHPGVRLKRRIAVDSPNYLFLELQLAPRTRPGRVALQFRQPDGRTLTHHYELRQREPGSARRKGFGPEDAVYLVVPDRFANGDPGNDDGPGLQERAKRADPSGRHGGDLAGLTRALDYIAGMGFTQLWSTPLLENNQPRYSYHGYAITDLYRIDPRFGSNEDYRRFVAAARQRGIGVIQDIVLNHIGDRHWWMQDLPTPDWVNHGRRFVPTNHAHIAAVDPHAAPEDRHGFIDGWFDAAMPDLNTRQPLLADYLIQHTVWWIEYAGLSGVREDTYSYADKDFLARWSQRVMQEYPRLNLVGEEMSYDASMVAYWQRGQRNHDGYRSHMPSMMDFPLFGALRKALTVPEGTQQGLYELYQAVGMDFVYPAPQQLMLFDGNHDTTRLMAAVNGDEGLAKLALTFVATTRRIPQCFYGTEIGLSGPAERDDGRLRMDFPGGWAGDGADAFSGRGLSEHQRALQQWLRRLLQWRKTSAAVQHGTLLHYMPQDGVYVYFRRALDGGRDVMVVLNKNPNATLLDTRRFAAVLQPGSIGVDVHSGQALPLWPSLNLAPRAPLVLELQR